MQLSCLLPLVAAALYVLYGTCVGLLRYLTHRD